MVHPKAEPVALGTPDPAGAGRTEYFSPWLLSRLLPSLKRAAEVVTEEAEDVVVVVVLQASLREEDDEPSARPASPSCGGGGGDGGGERGLDADAAAADVAADAAAAADDDFFPFDLPFFPAMTGVRSQTPPAHSWTGQLRGARPCVALVRARIAPPPPLLPPPPPPRVKDLTPGQGGCFELSVESDTLESDTLVPRIRYEGTAPAPGCLQPKRHNARRDPRGSVSRLTAQQ